MKKDDCIFCKIAAKEIPGEVVYEDGHLMAFRDINPAAPVHILIIPRYHYDSIADMKDEDQIGRLISAGNRIAEKEGLNDYRFVINKGAAAGQSVFHVHLHLIGGRALSWPPG